MIFTTYKNTIMTYRIREDIYIVNKFKYKNEIIYILLKRIFNGIEFWDEEILRSENHNDIINKLSEIESEKKYEK